jgi:hypothetical protein
MDLFTVLAWFKWLASWVGWFGVGVAPLVAAAAVIWFFPPLRKWAVLAAIGWGLAFGGYTYGDSNGAARITAEWKAAEQRGIKQSGDARRDAEQDIPPLDPSPAPGRVGDAPRWMRDDPYNRDNH